jgi:hypothetical protein
MTETAVYPWPPVPRAAAPRVRAPRAGRHDLTGGRPDGRETRAARWTTLAWRAWEGGAFTLAAKWSAYAYALGTPDMNLKIIANMVKAAVSGMEPNDIGRMVEKQVRSNGGNPREFWRIVGQVAEARLDAWRRWDEEQDRKRRQAAAVDAGGDQ